MAYLDFDQQRHSREQSLGRRSFDAQVETAADN